MGLFSGSKNTGYGARDAKLAKDLRGAKNKAEADRIARKDGHKNAKDAKDWLKGRS